MATGKRLRLLTSALVIVALGMATFLLVRQFTDDSSTEAQEPAPGAVSPDNVRSIIDEEAKKPRFMGALLGIFVAPDASGYPQELQDQRATRSAGGCVAALPEQAGALALVQQPVFNVDLIAKNEQPQVVACGGNVTGVNYEYQGFGQKGLPATLLIARSVSRAWGIDAATDKVSTQTIAGRPAIVALPATPDGTGQTSIVIFPEDFGLTAIHAFNLSEAELLAAAESVAAASK